MAFVAWILGHWPEAQIIAASYAQPLADKHARDCRLLMQSDAYQALFKTRLSTTKASVEEFTTTAGGVRLSTSVGGPLTGRGADFILIDDALKQDKGLSDPRRSGVNE